jgi:hypothetical protein
MKYIPFSTVEDLRAKLGYLEAIVEENKEIIENYLLSKGIPYEILPDGSYAVDLGDLSQEASQEYYQEFNELNRATINKYREMGIFYFDPQGINKDAFNITEN